MVLDEKTGLFEQNRKTLERIAYRMLGSLGDARDVVQDTYIKWSEVDLATVQNSRAWLITVCSRLAINTLQSARVKRERYFGLWLPEPYIDGDDQDLSTSLELDESVSIALLLAMEKLSPTERASYLLREVFDYSFDEIAEFLGKSAVNCRQYASRARRKIRHNKPLRRASALEHQQLLQGFVVAAQQGNISLFTQILSKSVELYADGGGKAEAIFDTLSGAQEVGEFFIGIWRQFALKNIAVKTSSQWFNGAPGILVFEDGALATAMTVDVRDGHIERIYAVRNPDKLLPLAAV